MLQPRSPLSLLAAVLLYSTSSGQWCTPATALPYDPNMPGITRFALNDLDRPSLGLEDFPNNNYVNTGLSTTLIAGESYPVTIDFTIDAVYCPDMNLRIWMDLDHNGTLNGPGETLLTADHILPSTYTAIITIPEDALTGPTRLRVTAKMTSHGAHILPTPCDQPTDPIGYHGEFEDYDIVIVEPVGILDPEGFIHEVSLFPSPTRDLAKIRYSLDGSFPVEMNVFDLVGRKVLPTIVVPKGSVGTNEIDVDLTTLRPGIYMLQLHSLGHAT